MKVFKDAHVKFQAERVANVYMLRNSKVIVGGLWLSSASRLDVVEQSETTMVSSSEVQFYLEGRLGLDDADAGQGSPHHVIITPGLEQIFINSTWIKEIVG